MEHQSHPKEPLESSVTEVNEVSQTDDLQANSCHTSGSDGKHVRKSHHSQEMKGNLISRLNRVEGQIRGIKGLIEKDTYCDDVLTQIAAAQSALNSVGKLLLEGHMKSCIVERIQAGEHEVVDELLVTVRKLMK
ncbi:MULTISPECIES: metal-sensitive transcriptional regulator [unclassified Paenibacillus]|uniref:metal-sensitive transcriptional regulator n=1 Tax=unclassified Paenibacillus TaxID=185978 RepID=UPI0009A84CFF|nr:MULTISPECIES: metal-sensitive transcriptional regulator [unclassified Paenibacillus]SLK08441.1 DNA-binding transcriptional regulator, FrmR family [Paenibacillus sp. RU5A]SOC71043.1 DNA-binding transcriptional regulator, FrmR family [Paenibacillus sp. RU26A]SOC73540.1 DNA-binding transcriptional regulator, FrmR family [Paenibacillus sp. RU5M]